MMARIFTDLKNGRSCNFVIDEANVVSIKLFKPPYLPREVHTPYVTPATVLIKLQVFEHEVPVLVRDRRKLMELDVDLAIQRIIPHIDGIQYAKKIAEAARV